MERRSFIKHSGIAGVLAAGAAPALAQTGPAVKWRLASSFPKSLDTLYGGAEQVAKRVGELTGGKFEIRPFAAGEIVPGLQVLDAVKDGTVELGHTALYYYVGKNPAFVFPCALPFGLNQRQMNAWMYFGGGVEMTNDFLKGYNVMAIPAGNTGAQMGGWFKREIKTVADLKGVKFRIGGLAGQILAKLGVVAQQLAGGDIYPALEKGTIDGAEWVGPYDDEKLGFNKVAKYYYYPGWWEGGPMLHTIINLKQWEALPAEFKHALHAACAEANVHMVAKYDNANPAALRRLVAGGAQLRPYPQPVMDASLAAANELYDEHSAKFPEFAKFYEAVKKYRADEVLWFRVTEQTFDNYMARTGGISGAKQAAPAPKK